MTSIESQGQNVSYLNGDPSARTADARNAFNRSDRNWNRTNDRNNTNSNRRETGFIQSPNSPSNSFYRQAQRSENGAEKYPYPTSSAGANRGVGSGFNPQFTSASSSTNNGRADLRFDRTGLGERPSGALGNSSDENTNTGASNRVAQLPQPPTQLPAAQLPPALPNPATALPAAVPSFGGAANCNCGPNYVNPAANYAAGYQGYQPLPQAANSVPALNIQMPRGQFGNNTNSNVNPNCCAPQPPAGYGGYQGYQFQPGIGTPQFGRSNNPWWSSFLTGSGRYTPLVQFRNMPPGTYLGQGVIGQPTAYVDGQPIRNLLRYVSP